MVTAPGARFLHRWSLKKGHVNAVKNACNEQSAMLVLAPHTLLRPIASFLPPLRPSYCYPQRYRG